MKTCFLSVFVLLMLATAGCTSDPVPLSDEESQQISQQISVMHDSLKSAWERGDALDLKRYQLAAGVITYDQTRFSGEAFHNWADGKGTNAAKQKVSAFKNLRIDVLSRESAVSSWDFTFAFLDSLGSPGKEKVALMTHVWVKDVDDWRILHVHESTYDPPEGESE